MTPNNLPIESMPSRTPAEVIAQSLKEMIYEAELKPGQAAHPGADRGDVPGCPACRCGMLYRC